MRNHINLFVLAVTVTLLFSCAKKSDKDRAIELVESKYKTSDQKLDFENAKLDSLYNIYPQAHADSIKKGNELDSTLAVLESEIEHLDQEESDSVGIISAKLTKERYSLLEVAKLKPQFIGWKLSNVKIESDKSESLIFNFDKGITKIVE
ncbi:hypothetical protein EZ449_07515 [Pedobacter frigidisoli]|uniref:Uncharacterized protein n=1 Tax=Pedobacter frigidisoli TaxID=2530455 RepID=A0A4R0P4M9_9SPHI|nr:hypothetical protein [Pedobacter frigidisoli]TCD10729.1 hypothetical protein EZ449_07515 [Pedobacter frigidisoli]